MTKFETRIKILLKQISKVNTLTFKIIICFIAINILSILIISIIYFNQSLDAMDKQNQNYITNLCRNVTDNVDQYMLELERESKILMGNVNIQNILINSEQNLQYSDMQRLNDLNTVGELVLSFTSVRDSIIVTFYKADGEAFYYDANQFESFDKNLFDNEYIRKSESQIDSRSMWIIPPNHTGLSLVDGRQVFSIIGCSKTLDTNEVTAYITISSNVNTILPILSQNLASSKALSIQIVDSSGVIIFDPNASNIGKSFTKASGDQKEYKYRSTVTGWTTVVKLPPKYFQKGLIDARDYSLVISFLAISLSILFAIAASIYILKPIKYLTRQMEKVESGDFNIVLDENTNNYDIRLLYTGFNKMISEIKKLIQTLYLEKLLAKSSQIEALQFQINPHFLYNTLQTMEAIGEVHNISEIQVISQSLGQLLRYNVKGKKIVDLEDELNQIHMYFSIEKIRYKEKLDARIDVDESLLKCRIPKFILQPIIENSVNHGFINLERKGIISIRAERANDDLKIYIIDNGNGISKEKLGNIVSKLKELRENSRIDSSDYIGIYNVHKRLINYYGDAYGLEIFSEEDEGTKVIISLPFDQNA